MVGIVLYGSVARGDADRRSDIDLWVLVEDSRMENQRTANHVRQALEDRTFDTGRYAYETDVESLPAVPNYTDELRDTLSDGLVVHDTEKFETVRKMVFHGELDEQGARPTGDYRRARGSYRCIQRGGVRRAYP